jgi:cation diffusion facilitator CzcD-associated flavoprotein CzcO
MKKDAQYFETIIIGTGFSGLLAVIRLKKKRILNKISMTLPKLVEARKAT